MANESRFRVVWENMPHATKMESGTVLPVRLGEDVVGRAEVVRHDEGKLEVDVTLEVDEHIRFLDDVEMLGSRIQGLSIGPAIERDDG